MVPTTTIQAKSNKLIDKLSARDTFPTRRINRIITTVKILLAAVPTEYCSETAKSQSAHENTKSQYRSGLNACCQSTCADEKMLRIELNKIVSDHECRRVVNECERDESMWKSK